MRVLSYYLKTHIEARRFNELKEKKSDVPKSETFLNFTKITSAVWSINKIIPFL